MTPILLSLLCITIIILKFSYLLVAAAFCVAGVLCDNSYSSVSSTVRSNRIITCSLYQDVALCNELLSYSLDWGGNQEAQYRPTSLSSVLSRRDETVEGTRSLFCLDVGEWILRAYPEAQGGKI